MRVYIPIYRTRASTYVVYHIQILYYTQCDIFLVCGRTLDNTPLGITRAITYIAHNTICTYLNLTYIGYIDRFV